MKNTRTDTALKKKCRIILFVVIVHLSIPHRSNPFSLSKKIHTQSTTLKSEFPSPPKAL